MTKPNLQRSELLIKKSEMPTSSTPSLTTLPCEILEQILVLILRPEYSEYDVERWNSLGCTKVLTVNRHIHDVGRNLLNSVEQVITLTGRQNRVFRGPFEFGKPGYFRNSSAQNRIFIPPRFCELQVIRFRRLVLDIEYPETETSQCKGTDRIFRLERQIKELLATLRKTQALEILTIKICHEDWPWWPTGSLEHDVPSTKRLRTALQPVISIATEKKFRLVVEANNLIMKYDVKGKRLGYHYVEGYENEVVNHLRQDLEAYTSSNVAEKIESTGWRETRCLTSRKNGANQGQLIPPRSSRKVYKPTYEDFASKHVLSGITYGRILHGTGTRCDAKDTYVYSAQKMEEECLNDLESLSIVDKEEILAEHRKSAAFSNKSLLPDWMPAWRKYTQKATGMLKYPYSSKVWSLAPECRACLAIFATTDDLMAHVLVEKPRHARPFKRRRYNTLYSKEPSREIEKFKCTICAKPFWTFAAFERHRERARHHGRHMVGRWSFGRSNKGKEARKDTPRQ